MNAAEKRGEFIQLAEKALARVHLCPNGSLPLERSQADAKSTTSP
jgi:hypothetical protein